MASSALETFCVMGYLSLLYLHTYLLTYLHIFSGPDSVVGAPCVCACVFGQ